MCPRKPRTQPDSRVGFLQKGGQPSWVFESLATAASSWVRKAEEIDRMVHLGIDALHNDIRRQIEHAKSDGTLPLEHKPFVWDVTLFLAASAVEDLLKGILLVEHPEYVSAGKLSPNVTTHDLEGIAKSAGVQLSPEEAEFCRCGRAAILSFGRYPVAKECKKDTIRRATKGTAFEVYEHLFARLKAQIIAKPRKS